MMVQWVNPPIVTAGKVISAVMVGCVMDCCAKVSIKNEITKF